MISNLQIPAEYASGNRRLFGKDVDNVRCLVFFSHSVHICTVDCVTDTWFRQAVYLLRVINHVQVAPKTTTHTYKM